jgi:hypothetical protein
MIECDLWRVEESAIRGGNLAGILARRSSFLRELLTVGDPVQVGKPLDGKEEAEEMLSERVRQINSQFPNHRDRVVYIRPPNSLSLIEAHKLLFGK